MTLTINLEFDITPNGDQATIELINQHVDSYHSGKLRNEAMSNQLMVLQGELSGILQKYIVGQTTTHSSVHVFVTKPKSPKK